MYHFVLSLGSVVLSTYMYLLLFCNDQYMNGEHMCHVYSDQSPLLSTLVLSRRCNDEDVSVGTSLLKKGDVLTGAVTPNLPL